MWLGLILLQQGQASLLLSLKRRHRKRRGLCGLLMCHLKRRLPGEETLRTSTSPQKFELNHGLGERAFSLPMQDQALVEQSASMQRFYQRQGALKEGGVADLLGRPSVRWSTLLRQEATAR